MNDVLDGLAAEAGRGSAGGQRRKEFGVDEQSWTRVLTDSGLTVRQRVVGPALRAKERKARTEMRRDLTSE